MLHIRLRSCHTTPCRPASLRIPTDSDGTHSHATPPGPVTSGKNKDNMSLRSFLCQEYYYDKPVPIVVSGSLVFSCRASTAAKIRSSAGSPFRLTRKYRSAVQFQEQSEEYHCSSNTHLPRVEKGGRRQRGPVFNGVFPAFHLARVKAWTRLIFRLASQTEPFSRLPGRLEAMSGMIIKLPCALVPQILSCAHIYSGTHISSWLWPLKQRPGGCGVYVTSS